MNYKLLFLAAVALIAASCAKTDIAESASPRTITVTVSMPTDDAQTRAEIAPDGATPHGLTLKWTISDKLYLNFAYNGNYYKNEAPIKTGSISPDGKTAQFTITMPTQIPINNTFDLAIAFHYERAQSNGPLGFISGTNTFQNEKYDYYSLFLNNDNGVFTRVCPRLYTKKTGIVNTATPAIGNIELQHAGWIMALHFKNESGASLKKPKPIRLFYDTSIENRIWNGYIQHYQKLIFDFSTMEYAPITDFATNDSQKAIFFDIGNTYDTYKNTPIANGETITLYRWVTSDPNIPAMKGRIEVYDKPGDAWPIIDKTTATEIPTKTVENGKVYHVYMKYDGTNLVWGK